MATFAAFDMSDVITEMFVANISRQALQSFFQSAEDSSYESGYAEGYDDGHDDGYAEGYAQGLLDAAPDPVDAIPPTPIPSPIVFGDPEFVDIVDDAIARLTQQFQGD